MCRYRNLKMKQDIVTLCLICGKIADAECFKIQEHRESFAVGVKELEGS